MKKVIALLLVVLMLFGLVACSKGGDSGAKKLKFGVIYTGNNNFWDKVGDGAKAKVAELNKDGKYDVSVYCTGPQTAGAPGQIQIMEDMISQKYDGIIIAASDTSALVPTIDKAVEAGIPVVCMDTEVPDSKRLCFVGTDNYNFGRDCARELARVLDGKGKVIVQYLDPSMLSMAERARGFRETLAAEFPEMEIIFEQADVGGDITAIAANIETLASKYKNEMDGYCMLYAGGENAVNTWKQMGWTCEDVAMVLSDDIDPIIIGVKEGIANSSVVQGQYNWGYEGIRILYEKIVEGKDPEVFVETSCDACDKELAEKNYPDVKIPE